MKITHISLYPPKWELHCDKSWVAPYTKNLAINIPYAQEDEVFVIWDIDESVENYNEDNIEVRKVFSKWVFFYKDILKEIDTINPDVVHVQQELALYGNILSAISLRFLLKALQKRWIKVVITFHGIVDIVSIDKEFMKENFSILPIFMVKTAFKFIFNPLIRYSDEIIVHEELFKTRILQQYYKKSADNIHVVHHGIEDFSENTISKLEARETIWVLQDKKALLFMGFITGYKWIDLLIEWIKKYKDTYWDNFILYILWAHHPKLKDDENYKSEYKRLQDKAETELWDNVDWQAWFVDGEKMALYYPASDVVLFPYTRSISSSWPMALSIWYKVPFLASDVFSQSIDNEDLLFEKSANWLSEKLSYFFENSDKYSEVISQMRAERIWLEVGKETYNVYTK